MFFTQAKHCIACPTYQMHCVRKVLLQPQTPPGQPLPDVTLPPPDAAVPASPPPDGGRDFENGTQSGGGTPGKRRQLARPRNVTFC